MIFFPGELYDISTFNTREQKWCSLGEIRLKICEVIAQGGMRRAMKAVVVKKNDHPLLRHFTEGCTVVAKCYLDKVCEAVSEKGRDLVSIARKVCSTDHTVLFEFYKSNKYTVYKLVL